MNEISEHRSWREKAAEIGFALMWVDLAYGVFMFPLRGMSFFSSDRAYGDMVSIGFLLGAATLISGLLGKGRRRWVVVAVAFVVTLCWWFMAVGA